MPPPDSPQPDSSPESLRRPPDPADHVTENDYSPPRGVPFPIVGIGASAGGLDAFRELLRALPAHTGMAFVLVQHLDPQHESMLGELLGPATVMPVVTVTDGMRVEPDHVYVIPPNTSMVLADGHLRLARREAGLHLPIDIFLRSLADVQGSRAIGVVLSGSASDGSQGLQAIKTECGLTFVQNEDTARFSGMPRNAISTGAADYILSPTEIGQELGQISRNRFLIPSRPGDAQTETLPSGDGDLKRLCLLLEKATKVDFSHYKTTTLRRRISRRMIVLSLDRLSDYLRYIEQYPAELQDLYRDLLISVTSFFREPDSFAALGQRLARLLLERDTAMRIWVPGCATGEEVYSLAICVDELQREVGRPLPIQLFGTDISDAALDRARRAIYSETIRETVSPERLQSYFTKLESGFQITKNLRENCIFARHDITRDPPFSQLDLVSCRNMLIYFDLALQRRILPIFHYALKPDGLLLLGSAETTAAAEDLFTTLDKEHRIYGRKAAPVRMPLDLNVPASYFSAAAYARLPSPEPGADAAQLTSLELQRRVDRVIQSRYSPAAVVVDAELHILQFRGHTKPYLELLPGEASLNLLRMARESLVVPLRRAMQAASDRNVSVREPAVTGQGDDRREVTLEVTPIPGASPSERYYLIVFAPTVSVSPTVATDALQFSSDNRVRQLERELGDVREYLRQLTDEYEAHAEELRAANEEARSANEELQSTNEELGTTKEELQSANEELTTVNEELKSRNEELNTTNGDLNNLLSAVSVAVVMVDQDLRIRRFNTPARSLLDLGPIDTGRPVGHLRGHIETPHLERQVRNVIETLHAVSEELQDRNGHWYSVSVRPYRTNDHRIAGAVITFQDIDPLKRGLQAAEEARDYAEGLIETVREPLVVLNPDLRVLRATASFYETFQTSREETEGRLLYDLGSGQWNEPRLRELLGSALFRNEPFQDYEVERDFPHLGRRTMRLNARRVPQRDTQVRNLRNLLLAIEDVTERRELAEIRFQRLFETAKDAVVVADAETERILDVNPHVLTLSGFRREELVGKTVGESGPFQASPECQNLIEKIKQQEVVHIEECFLAKRGGGSVPVEIIANLYSVGTQQVVQLNVRDITARKQAAAALRESEGRFRLFVESVRDYALFQLSPKGRIVTWNAGAERLLGWPEAEILGKPADVLFTPEDQAQGAPADEQNRARRDGRALDERWHVRQDGTRFFASGVLTPVLDESGRLRGFAKIMRDITEARAEEERLRVSLEEKTALVHEIHHRVKNNLQVIVSLLSLQAANTQDPQALAAFEEAEGRIRAIARIHERLYSSPDLAEVEFGAYLTQLVHELVTLHARAPGEIQLQLDVADLVLSMDQAIPLGLMANELILNSLKHGLTADRRELRVLLSYMPGGASPERESPAHDGTARLQIADNGPGLPPGFPDPAPLLWDPGSFSCCCGNLGDRSKLAPARGQT